MSEERSKPRKESPRQAPARAPAKQQGPPARVPAERKPRAEERWQKAGSGPDVAAGEGAMR